MAKHRTEQAVDEGTGEISGTEFSEAQLTAMLPGLYTIKHNKGRLAGAYTTGCKPIRDYLNNHPGDQLTEGETGVFARLGERSGSEELDAINLAVKNPELVVWLASQGCLKLDLAAWRALEGKAIECLEIKRFIMPGRGSAALIIDREEKD